MNSLPKIAGLFVAGLVFLVVLYFFAKWSFAFEMASHSQNRDVAQFSVDLSPNEPQAHYALAVWQEKTFLPEDLTNSVKEMEKATSLSPNDYRLWLALGKSRWRNGDSAGAEKALQKALSLAPNYSVAMWTFGNFYFREGKTEESFDLMRRAAEIDLTYITPAIATLWQYFDGNVPQIKNRLGDSPAVKASLAVFLAKEKRFDEAVQVWESLTDEEKNKTYKQNGDVIFAALTNEKKFRTALKIKNRADETGKIFNSGFEEPIKSATTNIFDWQIADGTKPVIGQNTESKHAGNSSLFIIFNSDDGKDFRQIQQTVATEPNKTYKFESFYKTDLKTAATLRWEIVNAADSTSLASTEPIAQNGDWSELNAEFTTPENSEAIIIRLVRAECQQGICPIFGKVWFDDLAIR